MSLPEQAAPEPRKPSRWSFATVLVAMLVLIPGLCFGIAMPANWESVAAILAMIWVVVLLMVLVIGLSLGIRYVIGRVRR